MKRAWDIINDIHDDKNVSYYKWQNSDQGTYFGVISDINNFGFGKDYVFYNNKIKWCENLDLDECTVSITKNISEIQFIDMDNNCLIIGIKNGDAESYLED